MPSTLTWLDHSDKERRRVLDALDRFKETDTRDELGLSSIRDGFADLFFPGTSVLMTRARYFLFVPWLYLGLIEKKSSGDFGARLRTAELKLIETLGDEVGVIGRVAKSTLKRTASSIYWIGLGAWGIRTGKFKDAMQGEYNALLSGGAGRLSALVRDDDNNAVEAGSGGAWHGHLPRPPEGFPKEAALPLLPREAEYLRDRLRMSAPRSLLAQLTEPGFLPDEKALFPWLHQRLGDLSPELQRQLHHAQCFAEVMHGAALLYNLMLAEKSKGQQKSDTVDKYRQWLAEWSGELSARGALLDAWDQAEFWQLAATVANVREPTKTFVSQWIARRTWSKPETATDDPVARKLVERRELQLKGPARARLVNPRALELWGGESGTARLAYRWGTAVQMARDIVEGLDA